MKVRLEWRGLSQVEMKFSFFRELDGRSLGFRNINQLQILFLYHARQLHKQVIKDVNSQQDTSRDIDFPFSNPSKTSDSKALSQCLQKPLSITLCKTDFSSGNRLYLQKYPSVTSILQHTKPANDFFGLLNWRKSKIDELGIEQFNEIQRNTTQKGISFHQDMKSLFASSMLPPNPDMFSTGFLKSISKVIPHITNVTAVESAVVHTRLGYAGTLDMVAEYKGTLAIIDWKTSQKSKTKLEKCHSYPHQVVAYAGAVNYDENYPFQVCNAVLIIAYENGDRADVHVMDQDLCAEYWVQWLQRLHKYKSTYMYPEETLEPNGTLRSCLDPNTASPMGPKDNNDGSFDQNTREKPSKEQHMMAFSLKAERNYINQSLNARPVHNIGQPLNKLGKVITDEEIINTLKRSPGIMEKLSPFKNTFFSRWSLFINHVKEILKRKRF